MIKEYLNQPYPQFESKWKLIISISLSIKPICPFRIFSLERVLKLDLIPQLGLDLRI